MDLIQQMPMQYIALLLSLLRNGSRKDWIAFLEGGITTYEPGCRFLQRYGNAFLSGYCGRELELDPFRFPRIIE